MKRNTIVTALRITVGMLILLLLIPIACRAEDERLAASPQPERIDTRLLNERIARNPLGPDLQKISEDLEISDAPAVEPSDDRKPGPSKQSRVQSERRKKRRIAAAQQ
ncbi:MAG: hypothetical protein E4H02_11290 [Lentisphaerales bacterium]|nr:MAG: hypothetical protein E4H02_11290 [Lentisphaerales bacterium]